jgi:hypothetical protein
MSIKAVHLFFVTALSALAFGLGVVKLRDFTSGKATGDLLFGIAAFLAGCLIVWYGRHVYKKFFLNAES